MVTPLTFSTDPYDKNPLDELFNVLNPSFKLGTNKRFVDRDLPDSFFQQRSKTLNPKREEAIKRAQIGHFQSLRRRRHPSSDKDTEKVCFDPKSGPIIYPTTCSMSLKTRATICAA